MTQSTNSRLTNSQNLEELLKITVETTRKTLKCDRIIIYDASELPQAEVIAEAVDPKYASILGQTVIDPFLEGDYLESYCYGQAIAIENIYTADVNKNQLENLKEFKIKSLAIAPISAGSKLLAFLVAHQCSESQPWHSGAVDLLTEKANIMGFALSNIAKAQESKDFNFIKQATESQNSQQEENSQTMERAKNGNGNGNIKPTEQKTQIQEDISNSFADVNDIIANELGQENILNTAVHEVRHLLNCDRVVVYSLDQNSYGVVVAESVAPGLTKSLERTIDDPCFAARYIEKYSQGRVRAWNDIYSEDVTPCYLEQLEALEVKAKIVTPIVRENELFGLLIAHQCSRHS